MFQAIRKMIGGDAKPPCNDSDKINELCDDLENTKLCDDSQYSFVVNDKLVEQHKGKKVTLEFALNNLDCYKATAGEVIQSSVQEGYRAPFNHGFIGAAMDSYNNHYNLTIRPDDVWMAILTQFSLYVTKHAEALRYKFVNHEGQKELIVREMATLRTAHYDVLARRIIDVMEPFLIDDVKSWIMTDFSTTTLKDKTVESVVMMSAMQKYFTFKMELCCGIPNVTLMGTVTDWLLLRHNIDRLMKYDIDGIMSQWYDMLAPILDEFIASRNGKPNIDFWNRICHYNTGGSGPSYLSGWITTFSAFTDKGEFNNTTSIRRYGENIDNQQWPIINTNNVTCGIVTVPVTVNDNGAEYKTTMFAGQLFYDVTNSPSFDSKDNTTTTFGSTIQPRSDWFMALIDEKKVVQNNKRPW